MRAKQLHIIAFHIPYPPNYGGVIDVWHKIRALHAAGVGINLHCFRYGGRKPAKELEEFCQKVYYYPRNTGVRQLFSTTPYIVISRKNRLLVNNLLKDNFPILIEGLHGCYHISDPRLKGRTILYRAANIEHHYYHHLYKSARNPLLKSFFLWESLKLKRYEKQIRHASCAAAVSHADQQYLQTNYPELKPAHIPCFHANDQLTSVPGRGDYVLYHGNLSVPENDHAALFLIQKVFRDYPCPFIIAGMNPGKKLQRMAGKYSHIQLIANPSQEKMDDLLTHAHVHLLVTFQATGLKLKLLNALYQGRFVIANQPMLSGTSLHKACIVANTEMEIRQKLEQTMPLHFGQEEQKCRKEVLDNTYSNHYGAKNIMNMLF